MSKQINSVQSGQVLIDIVIASGVFAILAYAILSIMGLIMETVGDIRTRTIARHLAQEKIELLINLPYNDLGTTTGIPTGTIAEFEEINRNGMIFETHTSITYNDDPFDDIAPDDLLPTDYKQIRVEVSWEGQFSSDINPVVLVSNIAPRGVESTEGGGTLSVFVIDAQAQPVSQAQVHIVNNDVNPTIDVNLQTGQDGYLILPGAPACASCYHVTVSKESYSQDKTYTIAEVANPNKQPVTVSEGHLSEIVFIIDRLSEVEFTSYAYGSGYSILPNNLFRFTGSKTIGLNELDEPVYKFDQTLTTGSDGKISLDNIEWDNYLLSIPASQNQDLAATNPHQPFAIDPNTQNAIEFILIDHTNHNLLISIQDVSGSAIASASAILINFPSYIATQSSGLAENPDFGQVFFSDLENGSYDYTIAHSNYQTTDGEISVSGPTTDIIILFENE
jgi:hypothetical protein